MRILITAGNTQTPIDQVRVITNVFSGRTGSLIAEVAHDRGHSVCLMTSHPELVVQRKPRHEGVNQDWRVLTYRTFDDLELMMGQEIVGSKLDAIIHCAAVSDYQLAGTYSPASTTLFDPVSGTWQVSSTGSDTNVLLPQMRDVTAGKVKSNFQELWLRMTPTPKLIDRIRNPWGFQGVLVKFKLEVGPNESELLTIAESSRLHSKADFIVANTLSEMRDCAYVGPVAERYQRIERAHLADFLLDQIELQTMPR